MRILAFPKSGISYNDCFYESVMRLGLPVVEGMFSGGWLARNVRAGDWLHFHWPSFEYNVAGSTGKRLLWFLRFVALLLLARLRGGRIVWTAHNLFPHDRSFLPILDVIGRHIVIALAHTILVHGREPAASLSTRFPRSREKLVSLPHGHWIGYYPDTVSRQEARQALDLPADKPVFLFVGLCKPYKNLHGLVDVFRRSALDARLLIAGKFPSPEYRARIDDLAGGDPRIRVDQGFIADDRLQIYLRACDYVVVPYQEILTSGTAMLAMSFGRPLISVDLGFLKEAVPATVGILFPHTEPEGGLADALRRATESHFDEDAILAHAGQFTFDDAARAFARAIGFPGS